MDIGQVDLLAKHTQNRGGRACELGVEGVSQVIPPQGISVIELWGHPRPPLYPMF